MRIGDVGEFLLIEHLARIAGRSRPDVVVGIGDDAAALDLGGEDLVLLTVDSQVEGTHFVRNRIPPRLLGRRLLAVNASDIAAMGGWPTHALVSLVLPTELAREWVEELYRGLGEEADRLGVAVVGGNVARSEGGIVLDVALVGRVARGKLLTRAGAKAGDVVLVTGALGEAAAGLYLSEHPEVADPDREVLLARHLTPCPRVREGQLISASGLATAMIDLSDGLGSDIGHICDRSRVGITLYADRLPISAAVGRLSERIGQMPWEVALGGGEDYELCFTAPAPAAPALGERITATTGTPVSVVGEILPMTEGRWLVLPSGRAVPLERRGFTHF